MYGTNEERIIRLLSAADANVVATLDGVEGNHAHYLLSAGDFFIGSAALYLAADGNLHPMEGWLELTDEVEDILDEDEDEVRVSRDEIYDAALSACIDVDLHGPTEPITVTVGNYYHDQVKIQVTRGARQLDLLALRVPDARHISGGLVLTAGSEQRLAGVASVGLVEELASREYHCAWHRVDHPHTAAVLAEAVECYASGCERGLDLDSPVSCPELRRTVTARETYTAAEVRAIEAWIAS